VVAVDHFGSRLLTRTKTPTAIFVHNARGVQYDELMLRAPSARAPREMTARAAKARAIGGAVIVAELLAASIAIVFSPMKPKFIPISVLWFVTGALMLRQTYAGGIPVQLPSFDEEVDGLMLGGMSESDAIERVSRGEIGRMQLYSVFVGLLALVVVAESYGVGSNLPAAIVTVIGISAAFLCIGFGMLVLATPIIIALVFVFVKKRRSTALLR
jgi:hypothetical protein